MQCVQIYCTLGNFSKPVARIILPKLHTFLGIFVMVLKSFIFLVKSFLGNFYRHLATFSGHTGEAKWEGEILRGKLVRFFSLSALPNVGNFLQ